MLSGLKSIRQERASLERDRVVFTAMMEDAQVAEAFDELDSDFFEGVSDEEIEELINKIPQSDEEDEQVERILKSSEDLGIDEILNVNTSDEESEEI